MSYRDLEVWKLARQASISIHRMTLEDLPKSEMYEERSQIRRSVKSVRSNIVEGFGRKLNVIIEGVDREHRPTASNIPHPASRIPHHSI